MKLRAALAVFATALAVIIPDSFFAQEPSFSGPRLFVIVSIDQMRADYVTRYGPAWTGGLRRLVDGAASFPLAAYPYMNTVTCAGHATIGTGTIPAVHGMVLNAWFDRTIGKSVACTDDDTATLVHYSGAGSAPGWATAGGVWRSRPSPTSSARSRAVAPRVASMSLKARSAIGMAGHAGDLVLWFDDEMGWSTSTAFAPAPLPWLQALIAAHPVAADNGTSWTRLRPASTYQFDDDGLGEGQPNGWTRTFPHAVPAGAARRTLRSTPPGWTPLRPTPT